MLRILGAVANAVYSFVAAVLNTLGFGAPPALGWTWTERDELGNANTAINDLFKTYMQREAIKAGQFALYVNGMLRMSTAYTWGEPEYRITEPDSVMRIASCSKAFTTAAALSLIDDGTLRADQPVFELLGITENDPRVSPVSQPADRRVFDITVQHLVEHSAGWDYRSVPLNAPRDWVFRLKEIGRGMGVDHPPTRDEFARFVFNLNLDFAPGTDSKYSNIGYVLLGMVVEKASGMTFVDFLNSRILPPLGISDVFVGATTLSGRRPNEVVYEDPFSGPDATRHPADPTPAPLPYGGSGAMTELMDSGGGLVTSARSLARFIFSNNVFGQNITDGRGRSNGRRDGGMPGTTAVSESFVGKNGSVLYDMAFIFNQRDKSTKDGMITSPRLDTFVNRLKTQISQDF
jgi:CubicO group peptidase (beta-lactamase class C family)